MSKKGNVMRTRRYNFEKGKSVTMFNMYISSKAFFGLSPQALKLYMLFILNGKKNQPNIGRFARMMKVSPRSISRYYDELKEKGFLKVTPIGIKKYIYDFDLNGNVNLDQPDVPIEIKDVSEMPEETIVKETPELVIEDTPLEQIEELSNQYVEDSKTIKEYEDFAILENIYWTLPYNVQLQIKDILEKRVKEEPSVRDPINWVLNKIR